MATPRAEYTCFGANQGKNAAELPSPAAKEVSNPLRDPAPRASKTRTVRKTLRMRGAVVGFDGPEKGGGNYTRLITSAPYLGGRRVGLPASRWRIRRRRGACAGRYAGCRRRDEKNRGCRAGLPSAHKCQSGSSGSLHRNFGSLQGSSGSLHRRDAVLHGEFSGLQTSLARLFRIDANLFFHQAGFSARRLSRIEALQCCMASMLHCIRAMQYSCARMQCIPAAMQCIIGRLQVCTSPVQGFPLPCCQPGAGRTFHGWHADHPCGDAGLHGDDDVLHGSGAVLQRKGLKRPGISGVSRKAMPCPAPGRIALDSSHDTHLILRWPLRARSVIPGRNQRFSAARARAP
jgi:hypothetical protein